MTKRTRLFLFISGGIMVVGLGTGLVAAYRGGFQNLTLIGGSPGPEELAYVPADSRMVAFANIREIMDSELHQKLKALQPRSGDGLAKFEAETGVDVTRDVDSVVATFSQSQEHTPPLVFVRGRFDAVRIEGLVRSKGGLVEDYKGVRLLIHPEAKTESAVAFLEPGLLAVGGAPAVRSAIDLAKTGGASITGNDEVMRLVRDADTGNAWAVARFDSLAAGRIPAEVAKRLPPINWVTVTGQVNGGLHAAIRAETRDEAAGKDLRDVIQGMVALAKLQSGQRAELAAVINSVELGGDGKNVTLSLAVPMQAIDVLAGMRAPRPGARAVEPVPAPEPPATAAR
jgi:hypothetical protein